MRLEYMNADGKKTVTESYDCADPTHGSQLHPRMNRTTVFPGSLEVDPAHLPAEKNGAGTFNLR